VKAVTWDLVPRSGSIRIGQNCAQNSVVMAFRQETFTVLELEKVGQWVTQSVCVEIDQMMKGPVTVVNALHSGLHQHGVSVQLSVGLELRQELLYVL